MIFRNRVHLYLEKILTENTKRTQNITLRLVIKLANKTSKLKKRRSQILPFGFAKWWDRIPRRKKPDH